MPALPLRSGQPVYGHFVGLIHKTVAVLMFWRELKQFACIQSICHRKLGEQQLNSVGLCRPTLIHIAGIDVDLPTFCSKHKTFNRCWFNVGPMSATLHQQLSSIGANYGCICCVSRPYLMSAI